jgi:hypothetical protein
MFVEGEGVDDIYAGDPPDGVPKEQGCVGGLCERGIKLVVGRIFGDVLCLKSRHPCRIGIGVAHGNRYHISFSIRTIVGRG